MSEKLHDLILPHVARMPFPMKKNEPANPIQIGFLCAEAVAPRPHEGAHLFEQFRLAAG
jgi:hypothetical protein